ncbi:hypothetical protein EWM64_g3186 [Hericium alpestre]|uniref:RNB domain-containing protein n=1 Tax=Hericium alpestre TaxID=135208 RepID=A0A4Z0A3K8_9AGAM|nr:hypothetical protein EWM64_g3186 [Hericium alpestre]
MKARVGTAGILGVVIGFPKERASSHVIVLTIYGRTFPYSFREITYVVPDFIDEKTIARCGSAVEVDPHQLKARITVLKKLSAFSKEFQILRQPLYVQLPWLYDQVTSSDPNEWSQITLSRAIELLEVKNPNSEATRMAMNRVMMSDSSRFLADSSQYLEKQIFHVWPRAKGQRFRAVTSMLHSPNSPLTSFADKARRIVEYARQTAVDSAGEPPSSVPMNQFEYTPEDRAIIEFLVDSMDEIRSFQTDPYVAHVATIVKAIHKDLDEVTIPDVRQLLVNLGVFAPWEDLVSRRFELGLQKADAESLQAQEQAAIPKNTLSRARLNPTSGNALGPEDFYPVDPAESIRHDFGDLPVYVIDDYGAQELDDGVSVEPVPSEPGNVWFHIHIADPTSILPPSHTFAHQAAETALNSYFVHRTYSMFPESFLQQGLSLGSGSSAGTPDRVLTFSGKIDPSGDMVDYKVRAGIIHKPRLLKYADVDLALSEPRVGESHPFGPPINIPEPTTDSLSPADFENIRLLKTVADRLRHRRYAQHAIYIPSLPTATVKASPNPLPTTHSDLSRPTTFRGLPDMTYTVSTSEAAETGAHRIVSEGAQLACRIASFFGVERGLPIIRRTSTAPPISDSALANLLANRNENGFIDFNIMNRLNIPQPPAANRLEPLGHWQLGVLDGEGYARATSPLRRYSDLLAHWQIKHALLHPDAGPLFSWEEMATKMERFDRREHKLRRAQRAHVRFWAMFYLQRLLERPEQIREDLYSLRNIEARASKSVSRNTVVDKQNQAMYVPRLGLAGYLEGSIGDPVFEVGESVNVAVDRIEFYHAPRLILRKN